MKRMPTTGQNTNNTECAQQPVADLLHAEQPAKILSEKRVLGVNLAARVPHAPVQFTDVVEQEHTILQALAGVIRYIVAVVPASVVDQR